LPGRGGLQEKRELSRKTILEAGGFGPAAGKPFGKIWERIPEAGPVWKR